MTNKTDSTLAEEIIGLEKNALNKWFKGDTSGYLNIWSQNNFSYFDGVVTHRIDTYDDVKKNVLSNVEGKLFADHYDFCYPRIQAVDDMVILTYQLHADTSLIDMHYNCIEIYQKEESGWKVVHSTWSFIRPMDMTFDTIKSVV